MHQLDCAGGCERGCATQARPHRHASGACARASTLLLRTRSALERTFPQAKSTHTIPTSTEFDQSSEHWWFSKISKLEIYTVALVSNR